jgi:hypothetical protein
VADPEISERAKKKKIIIIKIDSRIERARLL